MSAQVFLSHSKVPPARWGEAFPDALIVHALPATLSPGAIVWLHNTLPTQLVPRLPTGTLVVVLEDRPSDEKGLAALAAGAVGYANAHAAPAVLQAIESVVRNHGLWVGESLLTRLLRSLDGVPVPAREPSPALEKLSEREREVALKVARGESNKEIARELGVAERTVKAHLSASFEKLGVRDRLQLALLLKTAT